MHSFALFQGSTDATGGSPLVIALALLGLLVTASLSLGVAYLVVRGYRRNRNRARLYLAVGLILLTTGPIVIQALLTNVTTASEIERSAAANASKLLGLGAMLYAIYGASRPSTSEASNDAEPHREVEK